MNRTQQKLSASLVNEKKRKLFLYDELSAKMVDADRLYKRHRSAFTPLTASLAEDDLESLMYLYSKFRTESDDRKSDDVVMLLTPSQPPNSPHHKNLLTGHAKFSKHTPKLCPPKIINIEAKPADMMNRLRGSQAFSGSSIIANMIWTREVKTAMVRRKMSHLEGDTLLNQWRVPLISFDKLAKIEKNKLANLFPSTDAAATPEDDPDNDMNATADELELKDQCIPYPFELSSEFGKEVIEQFEPDIVVILKAGSGEFIKAALTKSKVVCVICATTAHTNFVMKAVKDWAKRMGIVSFDDAPKKPANLVAYEKSIQIADSSVSANAAAVSLAAVAPNSAAGVAPNSAAAPGPAPAANNSVVVAAPSASRSPGLAAFGSSLL